MQMLDFREMPYSRPDMDALKKCYEETIETIQSAATYEGARKAFFDLQEKEQAVSTMGSLAHVRNTIDTTDPFYEAETKWLREQNANLIPLRKAYRQALAACPFRSSFDAEFGPQLLRMIDASLRTTDERIIPDTIREGELTAAYQKDSAMASTEFRGEKCNFYGLLKHMESTDREERREAFRAWAKLYAQIAPKLDEQYDELVHLREGMAKKLGFASYTDPPTSTAAASITPRRTPPASAPTSSASSRPPWPRSARSSARVWAWTSSIIMTRPCSSPRATPILSAPWRSSSPRPRRCTEP